MSSYIIAGSADSIDTAYVLIVTSSAKKLPAELTASTRISISELSSSTRQNGNNTYSKFAGSTDSSKNQTQLSTPLMARS